MAQTTIIENEDETCNADCSCNHESAPKMSGADMVIKALEDQGVDTVFGYPGGALLPIYDSLHQQDKLTHILTRHEQGALHAAEGYARSTGKVAAVFVTSGPGATNAITGLTDAMMDSIPLVCICGQVPTFLMGTDAFQEADTTGITRHCTKHNYLVKDVNKLAETIHAAFHVAKSGRPGPVVIDLPKDVQFAEGIYKAPGEMAFENYRPQIEPDMTAVERAVDLIASAKKPIFYTGGGVINSGPHATKALREFVKETGFPVTSTLMGLGAYPASDDQWLGMLGMHGTYEANLAMHDCDVMINIGARFDDRVTGTVPDFSPNSKKIHVDIDLSSINKNVTIDIGIVADAGKTLDAMLKVWRQKGYQADKAALDDWWAQIETWRAKKCLRYEKVSDVIKPQYALERIQAHIEKHDKETYISTEVGQHQMWAAQYLKFEEPNHWMTSGGLGTMGYGFPAAIGVQKAHPDALVIDIAGDGSIQMNIQEIGTAIHYNLPVKVFILNNNWLGMVRQWQELLHGERYSEVSTETQPDFIKLVESYGGYGFRATTPDELDDVIEKALNTDRVTFVDIRTARGENVFPMIPAGNPHNKMLLSKDAAKEEGKE